MLPKSIPSSQNRYERISTWNDANGCAFIFSAGGGDFEFSQLLNSTAVYTPGPSQKWITYSKK